MNNLELYKNISTLDSILLVVSKSTSTRIDESIVNQYISVIEASKDLLKFAQIEQEYFGPTVTSFNMLTGEKSYSSNKSCDKDYFLTKINSAIIFLNKILSTPEETRSSFGF